MKLLIDDQREGCGFDVVCRTDISAMIVMKLIQQSLSDWDEIAFDHDLGQNCRSGVSLMKWCFEEFGGRIPAKQICIVTSNPVGRENMVDLLRDHGYIEKIDNCWGYMVYVKEVV